MVHSSNKVFLSAAVKGFMKVLLFAMVLSSAVFAGGSSTLLLRAHVPYSFRVEVTDFGQTITHSNLVASSPRPRIETSIVNGLQIITVTHP